MKFNFENEEGKGIVSSVTVDGTDMTSSIYEDFQVMMGTTVGISFNVNDYKLNSFKVNGTAVNVNNYYSFTAIEATTIDIDAEPYGTYNATINIDHPECVTVYKGYYSEYSNNVVIPTPENSNTVAIPENNRYISIIANPGCYISSVNDGTNELTSNGGMYYFEVQEGMVVNVSAGAIERNQKAIIYIGREPSALTYFSLSRTKEYREESITANGGYNEVMFYEGDNPFYTSRYDSNLQTQDGHVYVNGSEIGTRYGSPANYMFTLGDGDVVKIFPSETPESYEVSFTLNGVPASDISLVADRINSPENWTDGLTVLQGTELSLTPAEGTEITVTVNGEDITAAEGAFTFTVNAASAVSISEATAIGSINAVTTGNNVYNLQGIRILKNASDSQIGQLPAGIYIMNGKKIIVH